jgi:hypothetical protein
MNRTLRLPGYPQGASLQTGIEKMQQFLLLTYLYSRRRTQKETIFQNRYYYRPATFGKKGNRPVPEFYNSIIR